MNYDIVSCIGLVINIDIYNSLRELNLDVEVYDPHIDSVEFKKEFEIELLSDLNLKDFNSVIIAVAHKEFLEIDFKSYNFDILFDLKSILDKNISDFRL